MSFMGLIIYLYTLLLLPAFMCVYMYMCVFIHMDLLHIKIGPVLTLL